MKAANDIAGKVQLGSMDKKEGAEKIRALQSNFTAQIALATARLPSPEGKIQETAPQCPWCEVVENVDIEALPADKTEPDFELAKVVKAYHAKLLAEAKRK